MNAWNGNGPSPESHTDFRGSLLALENNLLRKRLREVLDGSAEDPLHRGSRVRFTDAFDGGGYDGLEAKVVEVRTRYAIQFADGSRRLVLPEEIEPA